MAQLPTSNISMCRRHAFSCTRRILWLTSLLVVHLGVTESFLLPFHTKANKRGFPRRMHTKNNNDDKTPLNDGIMEEKKKKLNHEFVSIAIPALLQQAAVPVADLVDAAYLRRLGPATLGGVGVARASQAAVSKLCNSPLSKTTISLIASKYGAARSNKATEQQKEELSVAVSTGLLLALTVGMVQLLVFTTCARPILGAMGISKTSDMASTAISYMRARALNAPISTLWLVSNSVFRGLGDTTTPLLCSILLNIVNVVLDPLLLRWGAPGVAVGTAISQCTALIPLMYILNQRVPLNIQKQIPALVSSLKQYLEAGTYVLGRTIARVAAFTFCSRQSALLGSVAASAYSITFQIGFGITLFCESISVAAQTLVSREFATAGSSDTRIQSVSHLVRTALSSGICMTGFFSLLVLLFQKNIVASLTTSPEIQQAALGVMPAFVVTQLIKGWSFPVNGIIMGGLDWKFSMLSMWIANIVCFATLRLGVSGGTSLVRIWIAWSAFMGSEAILGLLRYASRTGRWKQLKATAKN